MIALQKAEKDFIEYEKLRSAQIEDQNKRMTKRIFDEIQQAIVRHAKMKHYASVIDRSAKSRIGTDLVLFVDTSIDITAAILDDLNRR